MVRKLESRSLQESPGIENHSAQLLAGVIDVGDGAHCSGGGRLQSEMLDNSLALCL